tara:strand:+ start:731 stop:1105 length:375 start_codon:yes stop_codon:yes gene_type:complete
MNGFSGFKSPAQQRVVREGEGQDQDKIFDEKGNHVGNWVDGKQVMFTKPKDKDKKPAPTKQMPVKNKGFGPSTAFGGVKNPELTNTKKKKEKKVFKDGSSNRAHYKGKVISNWNNPYAVKPKRN